MILRDGTDTREKAAGPGRYCDGMAVLLDQLAGMGGEDDFAGDFSMTGTATRFGRRVLQGDTDGFLWTETYPTVAAAKDAMLYAHDCLDDSDGAR